MNFMINSLKNLLELWQGTREEEEEQSDRSHEGQSNKPEIIQGSTLNQLQSKFCITAPLGLPKSGRYSEVTFITM